MGADPQLVSILKSRKAALKKRGRPFRIRVPRVIPPTALERELERVMKDRLAVLAGVVSEILTPRLEYLLAADNEDKPRLDALSDDLFVILNGIRIEFARRWEGRKTREKFEEIARKVELQNKGQQKKVLLSTLGIDVFKSESWLRPQIANFVEQNVNLITSVDEQYFGRIQESVFRGARTGLQTKEIAKEIRDQTGITERRSKLIARDQVQKFNGQLTMLRQRDLGVSKYTWRTALDERVRPDHAEREGKVYSWDDPPDDGHPGEPINCRCYAEPILEDLIDEPTEEI